MDETSVSNFLSNIDDGSEAGFITNIPFKEGNIIILCIQLTVIGLQKGKKKHLHKMSIYDTTH